MPNLLVRGRRRSRRGFHSVLALAAIVGAAVTREVAFLGVLMAVGVTAASQLVPVDLLRVFDVSGH